MSDHYSMRIAFATSISIYFEEMRPKLKTLSVLDTLLCNIASTTKTVELRIMTDLQEWGLLQKANQVLSW